jgi:hypothetical protein
MSYLSIIQKDLPLATWGLDETPSSGNSALSDTFINSPGTYSASQSVKSVPFVYGSDKSIVLNNNGSNSYALKIPSLDRLSEKSKRDGFSIEFWIKFIDKDFSSVNTKTKILGKLNHDHTGVYLYNSSIIAMVGDTLGNFVSTSISLPNTNKPMHIVLSYQNNSVSLFVNGEVSKKATDADLILKSYNSSNEYFTFHALETSLTYALDNVAIYSRTLDTQTVRRHLAYGFGYEFPDQVANFLGGYRYPISMSDTKPASVYEQYWNNPVSVNNVVIEKGYLTIKNIVQPSLKVASDKDESIFQHTENGLLMSSGGGYVEIESPTVITGDISHGFGFTMHKLAGSNRQSLIFVSDKFDPSKYFEVYINTDGKLYSSYSLQTPVELATLDDDTDFNFGYYYSIDELSLYDIDELSLTIFSGTTKHSIANLQINPDSIRMLSEPLFTSSEDYEPSDNPGTKVAIKRIFNINKDSIIGDEVDKYVATHSESEKRFIMSSRGSYVFDIDLKKISGANDVVGNNIVSWGYDGTEVEVSLQGNNFGSTFNKTLSNRRAIPDLALINPLPNKYVRITINIQASDIELAPPKIYYFRIYTYLLEDLETDLNKTLVVSEGPDLVLDLKCTVTSNEETPFLYNEEKGGLYIKDTGAAYIDYDSSPISADTGEDGKIGSVSFFINPSSTSSNILSISTTSITYSSPTLSGTGVTFYVNGNAGSSLVNGQWNHVVAVFTTAISVPQRILFGGTLANFYLDEIIVLGKKLTANEASSLFGMYKGYQSQAIGSASISLSIIDTETTVSNVVYQPIITGNTTAAKKIKVYSVSTDSPIYVDAYSSNER